ncbi:hypothetical protein [Streptomyces sp. NPDC058086]|uniref:hypothetical protein n=1 Tax=Streptomyces sp. NPDC058086 TaxID=3346334 RepID=UPI0036E89071
MITLSVSDVDQAAAFYTQVGFVLDVDYHPVGNGQVDGACRPQWGIGEPDTDLD